MHEVTEEATACSFFVNATHKDGVALGNECSISNVVVFKFIYE